MPKQPTCAHQGVTANHEQLVCAAIDLLDNRDNSLQSYSQLSKEFSTGLRASRRHRSCACDKVLKVEAQAHADPPVGDTHPHLAQRSRKTRHRHLLCMAVKRPAQLQLERRDRASPSEIPVNAMSPRQLTSLLQSAARALMAVDHAHPGSPLTAAATDARVSTRRCLSNHAWVRSPAFRGYSSLCWGQHPALLSRRRHGHTCDCRTHVERPPPSHP